MAHIDFLVENLDEAVAHALKCGATKSEVQYYETSATMFDPEGHPFCLSTVCLMSLSLLLPLKKQSLNLQNMKSCEPTLSQNRIMLFKPN